MDELKYMIEECRACKAEAKETNERLKYLKDNLRTFMVDAGVNKYEGVEVRRVKTFDLELLRIEYPVLYRRYCSRIQKIVFKNEWQSKASKELFQKKNIDIYNDPDYLEEKTARLYGL